MARQQLGVAPSQPLDTVTKQYADSTYTPQSALANYAPLTNPGFVGTPTAPTATAGNSSTQLATTAFVAAAVAGASGNPTYIITTSTNASYWAKIATFTVSTVNGDAHSMVRLLSTVDGTATGAYAEARLHVHQGSAFGVSPTVEIALVQSNNQLTFDDFAARVTSNGGPSVVDFYVQVDVVGRGYVFNELNRATSGTTNITYLSNQAYVSALPAGVTQIAGVTDASYYALLVSPALTGTPTAPSAAALNNSTQIATTAYVDAADRKLQAISTKTAAYTFVLADAGTQVEYNVAGTAATFTIPLNATVAFPVGTVINLCNINTGALTIAITSGGTLVSPAGFRLTTQYATASLVQRAANVWVLSGFTVV